MKDSKIIINFIYLITKLSNMSIIQERVRKINYDEFKCITLQEKEIKRLSNSCDYLFHNMNQVFVEELLTQSYFLLTNELLEESIAKKMIEIYYKNIDVAPHSLATLLHLYIIHNIKKRNIEFAFLISNYIMLKKERWFLMPYEYCHNDYREAIENNDLSSLIRIFYDIELVKKEKKPCSLTLEEVIKKVKTIKENLINEYNIDKLYLFGSFAKGKNTGNSDLDFTVVFNESLINKEKNEQMKVLKKYMSNEFNCDVDLLDFSYAIDTFDASQMEYLITLI